MRIRVLAAFFVLSLPIAARGEAPALDARELLATSGVKGGLIVHLGCGDGKLTAALRAGEGYLVHGLDAEGRNVDAARKHIRTLGLYGSVSVDRFDGKRLPYVDNLVNLVVAKELGAVSMSEVMRALAPGGVAYVMSSGEWKKTVKPRPMEIDEWTHFLHDAANNAVSADSVVGPPRQLQWVGNPPWARSHDHLASLSAAVCAGGRLFFIVDEGPIAAVVLEPKWQLVACDAFSGVVLWKRPIPVWQWHLRGFRSGPNDLARRLVAVGDRVYVTLGSDDPVSALDAATGQTLTTYAGTDHALEIVWHENKLFVVAGVSATEEERAQRRGERPGFVEVRPQRPPYPEDPPSKRILAIDAASGRMLWQKADAATAEMMPTALAVADRQLFFENADELTCLEAMTGKTLWRASRPVAHNRPAWSAPTLVVYHDVVLSADRAVGPPPEAKSSTEIPPRWFVTSGGGQAPVGELIAFSAMTGQRLWNCPCREGYNSPVDVLVADGLVWTGDLVTAKDPGITMGRDPKTGEVKRTRPNDHDFFDPGMGHHRCYRNKATSRYLVVGRAGTEFVDLATGVPVPNHWTRGGCQYGVIPCNGMLYVPPHSCACFINSKLNGFNCLAPQREPVPTEANHEQRLETGPAYALTLNPQASIPSSDWPTYRHDPARSGRADCAVAVDLKPAWQVDLGGRLSSVIVAEGKLLLAQIDAHTVHALDALDGHRLWSYTAGGRVDSPPTVWKGSVVFGSADGWVYCLRASDGALAWRFRAAPFDQRIVSIGQVESAWPVPGSVLVQDGVAQCIAGRSSYLDGGIRLCRLDAATGRLLSETVIDHRDPKTGCQARDAVHGTDMPGALPDVLSCDGSSVYLRHVRFDLAGQVQPSDVTHLFSPAGFLDDSWWHRTYWMVGKLMGNNYGGWPVTGSRVPAGRLLVLDGPMVYGFGRNQYSHTGSHIGIDSDTIFHYSPDRYNPHETYYQLFAINKDSAPNEPQAKPAARTPAKQPAEALAKADVQPKSGQQAKPKVKPASPVAPPSKKYLWTQQLPILARGMVLAGDHLFLAGPSDVFKVHDPLAAIEGRSTGTLVVVSAADGKPLAEYQLDSPPVFDGMAAAGGRLYIATLDGKVLCYGGTK
jgi:outer membrane protein assembly factor BamB